MNIMAKIGGLLATLTAIVGLASPASAEEPVRPVLSAYTLRVGSAHLAETYLSPLRYSGEAFGVGYERMQAMKFSPERWVQDLRLSVSGAHTCNPARNGTIWHLAIEGGWSMMHRWNLAGGWTLYGGGSSDIEAGLYYSRRNSNNPVAAKASWTVSAMGAAAWNGRVGRRPVTLRYMLRVPVTGIFFSPEYGELYYEIYLGNHKGLVRGAWPGNHFRMDNLLTADLHFGATTLRLGYGLDLGSTKASDIVARRISHTAVVGVCSEWVSLAVGRRGLDDARIISALY